MRAGAIATRNERCSLVFDDLQRAADILHARDPGGIAFRSKQHEVVVHHRVAFQTFALCEEFQFFRFRVYEYHVGVAAPAGVERLAAALRDHLYGDAGSLFDYRQ